MKRRAFYLAILLALVLVPTARLEAQTPWIHIQVTEDGGSKSKVHINLPLSVVQVALDMAPEKFISHGRIKIDRGGHHGVSVADLRRLWQELRDSGEAEFVTVENEDGKVVVTREGDLIRIEVDDRSSGKKETVNIKLPVNLVDALLSGEGEALNIRDALEELKDERGEIVRVESPDEVVRIWIDERSGQ